MRITGYQTNSLYAVSTGLCPDCKECARAYGFITEDGETDIESYNAAVETEDIFDEGSFSWNPCDDCNTRLGGDSFYAHGLDSNNEIIHFRVCYDCLMELNGYSIKE